MYLNYSFTDLHGQTVTSVLKITTNALPSMSSHACAVGLQACDAPFGVSNDVIPNSAMTASSIWSTNYRPYYARLNRNLGSGGWCGRDAMPVNPDDWFQVDLGRDRLISAIATQGIIDIQAAGADYYLLKYMVRVRQDGSSGWLRITDLYFGNASATNVSDSNNTGASAWMCCRNNWHL